MPACAPLSFAPVSKQRYRRDIALIRILLVDDNPAIRRCLRRLFEGREDWRVCGEAADGSEALQRFQQGHPDLVVLDFQMPAMNGFDAARKMIQMDPATPILMLSVYFSKQLADEARHIGIRGVCAKGDISAVVHAAEALLRSETYFPESL